MITGIGIDMAFANVGLSRVVIHADRRVECVDLRLISTEGRDKKTVRKSSDELRRARELLVGMQDFCRGAALAFAEVPSGSQSASAARALGIAVGVLAACPLPVIEVSQLEAKLASVGKRSATKPEVIAWAVQRWPQAPWLQHHGKTTLNNEHLADSLAAVVAGVNTPEFQRLLALTLHHEATGSHRQRRHFKA